MGRIYNRALLLPAIIESVLAQTHSDFDLLIWDDGSTDDSVAVARHYAAKDDRLRFIAAAHQGIAPTLKSAIAATTGTHQWQLSQHRLVVRTATVEPLQM